MRWRVAVIGIVGTLSATTAIIRFEEGKGGLLLILLAPTALFLLVALTLRIWEPLPRRPR